MAVTTISPETIGDRDVKFTLAPEKPKHEESKGLTTSELEKVVENEPFNIAEKYGDGVAREVFGTESAINLVAFDRGALVIPKSKSVIFTETAQREENLVFTETFFSKPWEAWANEVSKDDSSALNIKLELITEQKKSIPTEGEVWEEGLSVRKLKEDLKIDPNEENLPPQVRGLVAAQLTNKGSELVSFESDLGKKIDITWDFGYEKGKKEAPEKNGRLKLIGHNDGKEIPIAALPESDIKFLYKELFGRSYRTGEDVSYGDPAGETYSGVEALSKGRDDFSPRDVYLEAKIKPEIPDISSVYENESLVEILEPAEDAINKSLPKWDQMEKNPPLVKELLYRGNRERRLVPVIISPDLLVFKHVKLNSTILAKKTEKGWVSRYFTPKDGNVAEQIDSWL